MAVAWASFFVALFLVRTNGFLQRNSLVKNRRAVAMGSTKLGVNREEERVREQLMRAALSLRKSDALKTLLITGKTTLPTTDGSPGTCCMILTEDSESSPSPALIVPFDKEVQLNLLECVAREEYLELSRLYVYNMMLVGRDNGIYDNVPWSSWTIDPDQRNRDAANNLIDDKFHMGKRDAYNRFMGKELMGKSKILQRLQQQQGPKSDSKFLQRRILEIQVREQEMDMAELDYQMAINRGDTILIDRLTKQKDNILTDLQASKDRLRALEPPREGEVSSWLSQLFQDTRPEAPYPGATGYSRTKTIEADAPYRSPYDLLLEMFKNQLQAEVIGIVLENTSLLEGTLSLGGAVVLRRITPKKTVSLGGEKVQVEDEDQDFGNPSVSSGETYVVECDADEAAAISLSSGVPLQVEMNIWARASRMVERGIEESLSDKGLPVWMPCDPELSVLVEGQAGNQSATERSAPLRIPRTSTSLFDSLLQASPAPSSSSSSSSLFPTDNLVTSLSQYDGFSNDDKARTLLKMSNFDGRLPRPRLVRQSELRGEDNPLDEQLLPLIDESVRRQYQIRQAEQSGDLALAESLKQSKSKRQIAKEQAELARSRHDEDSAEEWETEAEFLESLRADVTQDEGSYSGFLDRDDWYERERQQMAKRVKKSMFGNLLDGIE